MQVSGNIKINIFLHEDKKKVVKYFVKPPEVQSLLRLAGMRREKTRSLTGAGELETITTVSSCLHYGTVRL